MAISARQKIRPIDDNHLDSDEQVTSDQFASENVTTPRTEARDGNGVIIAIGAIIAVIAALIYFTNGGTSPSVNNGNSANTGAATTSETAPSTSAPVTKIAPSTAQTPAAPAPASSNSTAPATTP